MNTNFLVEGSIIRNKNSDKARLMVCQFKECRFILISSTGNRWSDKTVISHNHKIDYNQIAEMIGNTLTWQVKVGKHYVSLNKYFGV